ncbi:MAG: hypothetical protein JW891_00790 [Candidatus Lokiarchaeota archaeon]|nr:hypothetical protein [Candidatus Lokiarchaeota archaeon]
MNYKIRNYSVCLLVFVVLFTFFNLFFVFELPENEDLYVFPGKGKYEWIFAINMIIVSVLCCGFLAILVGISAFLKIFIKIMIRKEKIGTVLETELSPKQHFFRLWGRALVLGFFISNIAYSLASNETVVSMLLTPLELSIQIEEYGAVQVPSAPMMLQLIWLVAIPCTLILCPIWAIIDSGLVSTKKTKGLDFSSVNTATSRLYKIIKGYAGIGFAYNLFLMVFDWAVKSGDSSVINTMAQILSPIGVISATFPLIVIMDREKSMIRKKIEKSLIKLDLNKELKLTLELKDK